MRKTTFPSRPMPIFLSGTPFRAIATGEFIEEQIYNWTYSDEQHAKTVWDETSSGIPTPMPRCAHGRDDLSTAGLDPRDCHAGRV
ncbi:MAG: hypothetical protein R3C44_10275 [Chloroflexota bacterium]